MSIAIFTLYENILDTIINYIHKNRSYCLSIRQKEKRTKEKLQQLELLDKKSESMKEQRMEDLAIQKTISEIQENLLTAASQGGYTTAKQQDDILAGGKQMFKLAGEELGFEYDEATKQFVNIPGITTKGTKADATDLAAEASRIYADGIRNRQLVDAIDIFQKVARKKYPKNVTPPAGGTGGTNWQRAIFFFFYGFIFNMEIFEQQKFILKTNYRVIATIEIKHL